MKFLPSATVESSTDVMNKTINTHSLVQWKSSMIWNIHRKCSVHGTFLYLNCFYEDFLEKTSTLSSFSCVFGEFPHHIDQYFSVYLWRHESGESLQSIWSNKFLKLYQNVFNPRDNYQTTSHATVTKEILNLIFCKLEAENDWIFKGTLCERLFFSTGTDTFRS